MGCETNICSAAAENISFWSYGCLCILWVLSYCMAMCVNHILFLAPALFWIKSLVLNSCLFTARKTKYQRIMACFQAVFTGTVVLFSWWMLQMQSVSCFYLCAVKQQSLQQVGCNCIWLLLFFSLQGWLCLQLSAVKLNFNTAKVL